MSIIVNINGNNQIIPSQGDFNWGNYTTATLVALAQSVFPKAGGNFFLTGDVNFGTAFGLIAKYFTSTAPNPSQTGVVRLAHSDVIGWRNNAGTDDDTLGVNSSDQLIFNGAVVGAGGGVNIKIAGNTTGTTSLISTGTASFAGGNNVTLSQNGNNITISAANQSGLPVFAGTTSNTVVGLSFSNSNNVSFGLNAGVITASAAAQTAQPVAVSGSNGSFTFSTLSMGNSNGLLFYTTNGSVVGSYTVPTQTVQTQASGNIAGSGFTTTSTNGTVILGTHNSAGLKLAVPPYLTTQSVQTQASGNIAGTGTTFAGTNISASMTLNSNGLNLALSGNTGGGGGGGIGLQVSNTTYTSGTITFQNANGISFGSSGANGISASYTVPTQSTQPVAISGSNGSFTFSTLTMGNLNGLTHYTSNGSLVGSYTVPSVPALSLGVSTGGNTAGNTGTYSGQAILAGGRNITLSVSSGAGGAQTISMVAPAISSIVGVNGITLSTNGSTLSIGANIINLSISGNTSGTPALVSSGTLNIAGGNNITLSQVGNSITISGANAGGAQTGISGFQVSNTTYTSGTVSLVNANGISFGSSGANGVSASYTVPSTAGLISNINVSAGTTSNNLSAVTFSNSNGLSFGLNGSVITASYTVPTQSTQPVAASGSNGSFAFSTLSFGNSNGLTHYTTNGSIVASYTVPSVPALSLGVSTGGNTLGNTGIQSGQAVFVGGNNITLSVGTAAGGAQTITISGPNAAGAQTGISGLVVSNTTYTSGTVTFQNANGISFGSSGANGVSASYTVPSTAGLISALRVSAGAGTSNNLTGITFANGNGLTFGLSTGASVGTMTASYNSTQFAGLGTTFAGTNISGSITLNSNGLNLALSGPTETGVAISAAGSSQTAGNIVFSNSNGVSFGMNGSTITASVAAAGGAQTGISGFQVSNTTYTSGTVSLVNANGISFGSSGANGVSASYTVPSVPALSLGVSTGGNTLGNTGTYSGQAIFVGGNNITLSVGTAAGGAQTITIVGAAGGGGGGGVALNDGVNTISTGTALLSGVNMTFSINGQTLSGSVPAVSTIIGANGISISTTGSTLSIINNPLSTYVPFTPASTSSQTIVAGLANSTASVFVYPFTVANNGIAFDVVNVGINYSNSASAATSLNWTGSLLFGLYSSNGSILSLMSSNSYSVGITSSGASGTLNYPSLTGTNGYTYGTTTASTTAQANNLWGGQRVVGLQFGNSMSLSVGQYWLGLLSMNSSSNHAGGQTAALMGNVWASIGGGPVGIGQSAVFTTAFSNQQPFAPMGAYTVTQSTLPSSIGFSNIANTVSIMPFMSFLST